MRWYLWPFRSSSVCEEADGTRRTVTSALKPNALAKLAGVAAPAVRALPRVHSCAKWPCRRAWRVAGRAITFVVQQRIMSDEPWSLKDACRVMDKRIAGLHPPRTPGKCERCGADCQTLQAFQMLASSSRLCQWRRPASHGMGSFARLGKMAFRL